ncbi:cytochrome c1 [Polyrhizophydium stewartii]|uniref:quinol--cytochrome-c reductase n=1 Tax=Polyrhizophydium stewartii TaxID=2732419 RepID=A0ABR4MY67_9FUNG
MMNRAVFGLGARAAATAARAPVLSPAQALRAQQRFASSSSQSSQSAFGKTKGEAALWFAKAAAASAVVGVSLSTFVLTDERLEPLAQGAASLMAAAGMPTAHAFSTGDNGLHPPHWPWDYNKPWATFDHAALRRGYQVYREVCAACHSMDYIYWRNLVGVSHTEEEVKAMAAEYEYQDGPDENGDMFMRPGKLSDPMPRPYVNDNAARKANGGALPPDLSCIVRARHGDADYIFSLLLGYCEPPAGVTVREGLHYNPYFPGGAIGMARSLYDEVVEYEDGTPNNASQLAKDVTQFLAWASYPEQDQRKKFGFKTIGITAMILTLAIWWKRFKWSHVKSKKFVFQPNAVCARCDCEPMYL